MSVNNNQLLCEVIEKEAKNSVHSNYKFECYTLHTHLQHTLPAYNLST